MSLYHDLYPHNKEAFHSVIEHFKTGYKTCVINAPGTGKTMVGLAVSEFLKKKTLFVTSTNDIIRQTQETMERFSVDLPISFITYDKLIHMSTEELDSLDPELLILDEFQHSGAPEYTKPIDYLEQKNPFLYVFGLSATPIRDFDFQSYTLEDGSTAKGKKDMAEQRFHGDVSYTYSLAEAIADDILFPPTYVRIYQVLDTTIKEYERKFKRRYNGVIPKDIENALKRLARLSNHMGDILKKYISNGKVLVYSSNIKELKENMEKFKNIYPNATFLEYHTGQSKMEQQQAMEDIQKNTNNLTFFFVVDKFSEGIHFP
ncbi:TPA: DEAD/DEAH box helicase family protein, partial [Candidatus Ventrenecus avicola]|nr:DEAD/DEAH box helicase family protein [Candidatus Ventrenecus avicola]